MLGLLFSFIIILFDQLTKFLIYGTPSKSVIGNLLWFESVLNDGVAFGLFSGKGILFIIFSSLCSICFIVLILKNKIFKTTISKFAIGIILGGTLSNLIDRIIFGGVRDFIYIKFIDFAIFNIADCAITIGSLLLFICLAFGGEEKSEIKSTN